MSSVFDFTYSASESNYIISYVCDIEGNLDYWNRFLSLSKVVHRDPETKRCILEKNCHFIFGGDACDRGPGDIRILRDLLQLKREYPEFVHLISGNRDVNKMRLPFELNPTRLLNEKPEVFWVKNNQNFERPDTKKDRLKWILTKTMGAPEAFEYRRHELIELNKPHDDDDIVASFLDLILPGGDLADYLLSSDLCLIFGDTLFIHGGVHSYNLWYVPAYGDQPEFIRQDGQTVKDWAEALNAFSHYEARQYVEKVQDYIKEINEVGAVVWSRTGGYDQQQPGSRLIHTGMGAMPDLSVNRSVIYSSYMKEGKAHEPEDDVIKSLNDNGIKRIVVGHQPIGDVPIVLKVIRPHVGNLQILCCDTSYAANVKWEPSDVHHTCIIDEDPHQSTAHMRPCPKGSTRGVAVSELIMYISKEGSKCFMHGVLSNGCPYEYEVPRPGDDAADVGSLLLNQWLVRAMVNIPPSPSSDGGESPEFKDESGCSNETLTPSSTESAYLVTKQEGYTVVNQLISQRTFDDMKVRSKGLPKAVRSDLKEAMLKGINKAFEAPPPPPVQEEVYRNGKMSLSTVVTLISGVRRAVQMHQHKENTNEHTTGVAAPPPLPPSESDLYEDVCKINDAFHNVMAKVRRWDTKGNPNFKAGKVSIKRIEARNMPNVELMTAVTSGLSAALGPMMTGVSAALVDENDPYAVLRFGRRSEWTARTLTLWEGGSNVCWNMDNSDPTWSLKVTKDELMSDHDKLRVVLMDANRVGSDTFIGQAEVSLKALAEVGVDGPVYITSVDMYHPQKKGENRGVLILSINLTTLDPDDEDDVVTKSAAILHMDTVDVVDVDVVCCAGSSYVSESEHDVTVEGDSHTVDEVNLKPDAEDTSIFSSANRIFSIFNSSAQTVRNHPSSS